MNNRISLIKFSFSNFHSCLSYLICKYIQRITKTGNKWYAISNHIRNNKLKQLNTLFGGLYHLCCQLEWTQPHYYCSEIDHYVVTLARNNWFKQPLPPIKSFVNIMLMQLFLHDEKDKYVDCSAFAKKAE